MLEKDLADERAKNERLAKDLAEMEERWLKQQAEGRKQQEDSGAEIRKLKD